MRARTEDLLTIRDGEPIDAAARERLEADAENAREVARLAQVAEDLRRLPLLEPPPGAWERIAAESATPASWRAARWPYWAAAAAVGAVVALLLVAPWRAEDRPETAVETDESTLPAAPLASEREPDLVADYSRLVAESVRLELLLAELEPRPRVMNAGTARTIADLEDQIVLLDEQLAYAEARNVDLRYRQALWRERVDVMSALVHVRYAQVQVPTY